MMKKLAVFAVMIILSACGWTPVYSQGDNGIIKETEQIAIAPLDGKSGIIAREKLRDQLSPYGLTNNPKYSLTFSNMKVTYEKRGIRPDGTPTWGTVITVVDFKLTQLSDNKVLIEEKEYAFTSYNILDNVYSATVAEEQAAIRGAKMIADQIATRIMAYFKDKSNEGL
ncbi:MAG: LPS assembly lipoprotein LptE [Rickettsiales bacterium]|jgi:LPS-assembly lipoprotein|nr:LPS assembly lipoprotein LptE [Rickettsiales bacterium]